jgi:WD40 repeat protein
VQEFHESGPLKAKFYGHKNSIYLLIAGPKPGDFISSGADGLVVQWNVNEPDKGKLLARVQSSVYALCLIPEYNCLLIACNGDGLHLLDLEEEKEIWNFPTPNHVWFRSLWDGTVIHLAGSKGSLLQIFLKEKKVNSILLGTDDLRAFGMNQDQSWMAFGNSSGEIFMHHSDSHTFSVQKNVHQGTVFALQFYPIENQMVTAGKDAKIKKWKFSENGEMELLLETDAHLFGIHDIAFHPFRPILASCSMDKTIKIWDAETLKLLRVLDRARHAGHGHSINQILWLAKPELLLSCSDDRTISAWDIFA